MASQAPAAAPVSPEEFLAIDREAEFKSEYYDGEIVAMSGASLRHNRIVANLVAALHSQLRRGPCQVFPSDMRVWNPVRRSYTFPDVVVVCGRPEVADGKQDVLELDSIGCTLALSDVYENALGSEVERVAAPDENHG
jgi:Uma2 family endonuclease